MTFTEAAIEVLRREGKPLHFNKLSEIAIRENLLDHVGKIPEETMADQLAAHCRLPRTERRVMPVQPGTFALVEWGLDEDPAGLEALVEPPPEGELPYRGRERHPIPSRDLARSSGRGEGRPRRREDEERRGRRFPPPAEVAYEILAGAAKPLTVVEIAATGAERALMPDAFVRDGASLHAALSEDNRRRESSGRKALFQLDGDTVTLVAQPEPGERAAPPPARAAAATLQDVRRTALAGLRRRLRECDGPTLEHVALALLEKQGFRDVKVAKRGREHVVCTGKRRVGLADVRHAIRILRSGADAVRRDVVDLRRDLGHYGAQIGIVVTPGEAAREARGEAGGAGQLPVVLLCGEALADAFADAALGCVPVVVPEVDDAFFRSAAEAAEKEEAARRARREERDRREQPRRAEQERRDEVAVVADEDARPAEPAASEPPEPREILITDALADEDEGEPDDGDADDDGPDEQEPEVGVALSGAAQAGEGEPGATTGERRRRRRRRRRRGGRGRGAKEGTAPSSAAGATAPPSSGSEGAAGPAGESAPAEVAPPPEPSPTSPSPASPGPEGRPPSGEPGGEGA